MGKRLDPLDEIGRLWRLLTAGERLEFLASISSPARPQEGAPPVSADPIEGES